ncbi:MAG: M56 family metallopeptidase [Christensenellales bacterium]
MTILSVLLSITVYSAVIYAAVMLFRLIFKKHVSPSMIYLVWFILIARLLVPVTIDSGFSLITIPPAQTAVQAQMTEAVSAADSGAVPVANSTEGFTAGPALQGAAAAQPGITLDMPAVLVAVWIVGMALMFLQTLAAWIKLKVRLSRDAVPIPDEWLAIVKKIKTELNIRGSVRVVMIRDFVSPALNAGIFPMIVMPGQMAAQDPEKIEFALRHEMTHLKRRDHLVCLLLVMLRIIYWFNPVIWLAMKQIKTDMEAACDSAAVRPMSQEEIKRYAVTVLDLYAQKKVRFVLGMSLHSTRKTAERRVRGIFMRKRSSLKARITVVILAAVILVTCFTTACQPVVQEKTPAPTSSAENTAAAVSSATPGAHETASGAIKTTEQTPAATASPALTPAPMSTTTPAPTPAPMPTTTPPPKPVAALPNGYAEEAGFTADTNGDGTNEKIAVCSKKGSEDITLFVLYQGGYDKAVVEKGTFQKAVMTLTGSGKLCLLVSVDQASEDYITSAFSFNGTKPVLHDEINGYVYDISGTGVTVAAHIDVIGTWDYTCTFKLKNDFTLEQSSDYKIMKNWMEPLHTIRQLPVEMLVGGAYAADTLPAGTVVHPVATDGSSYLTFKLDDGSAGRINFTRGEHVEAYIDGVIESEYFDNIAYSD